MSEPINLAQLRELPSNLIAGQQDATVNVPAYTLLALIDVVEAAHQAVITEYHPAKTDIQNRHLYERALMLRAALARFDMTLSSA